MPRLSNIIMKDFGPMIMTVGGIMDLIEDESVMKRNYYTLLQGLVRDFDRDQVTNIPWWDGKVGFNPERQTASPIDYPMMDGSISLKRFLVETLDKGRIFEADNSSCGKYHDFSFSEYIVWLLAFSENPTFKEDVKKTLGGLLSEELERPIESLIAGRKNDYLSARKGVHAANWKPQEEGAERLLGLLEVIGDPRAGKGFEDLEGTLKVCIDEAKYEGFIFTGKDSHHYSIHDALYRALAKAQQGNGLRDYWFDTLARTNNTGQALTSVEGAIGSFGHNREEAIPAILKCLGKKTGILMAQGLAHTRFGIKEVSVQDIIADMLARSCYPQRSAGVARGEYFDFYHVPDGSDNILARRWVVGQETMVKSWEISRIDRRNGIYRDLPLTIEKELFGVRFPSHLEKRFDSSELDKLIHWMEGKYSNLGIYGAKRLDFVR